MHTARWDDELQTDGKKIAVLGTGSTGVQAVSALQSGAAKLTHFVRTPQWVLWAPMTLPQLPGTAMVLGGLAELHKAVYQGFLWGSGILADVLTRPTWRRKLVQLYAQLSLRAQVRDAGLRAQLTPDYQPLCKRPVVSGSYYRALQKPNAELVTAGIEKVPNLFTILGPNSPTASISLQYSAELTSKYIAQWLERWRNGDVDRIEVTEEATDDFYAAVDEALGPTVWNTGCNSWYFTDSGNIDLFPFDRKAMTRMLSKPDPADFHLARVSADSADGKAEA